MVETGEAVFVSHFGLRGKEGFVRGRGCLGMLRRHRKKPRLAGQGQEIAVSG